MVRTIRLFLIRHGETVDNIAQVYAGRRDSVLTNHGYQQATRLGLYFKSLGLTFTHLFSSHLQRAVTTASKIREAQLAPVGDCCTAKAVPDIVQLPVLMEKDFGSLEGRRFHDSPPGIKTPNNGRCQYEAKHQEGFVNPESKDSMARRADSFLDKYLMPLFEDSSSNDSLVIAIVSHGIFLSMLWKRTLLRLPQNIFLSTGTEGAGRQSLYHIGGWSNTGYLELYFTRVPAEHHSSSTGMFVAPVTARLESLAETSAAGESLRKLEAPALVTETTAKLNVSVLPASRSHEMQGWSTSIVRINSKDHLQGLKRARGGLGSSRYDASQKSIDVFFKRRKIE